MKTNIMSTFDLIVEGLNYILAVQAEEGEESSSISKLWISNDMEMLALWCAGIHQWLEVFVFYFTIKK